MTGSLLAGDLLLVPADVMVQILEGEDRFGFPVAVWCQIPTKNLILLDLRLIAAERSRCNFDRGVLFYLGIIVAAVVCDGSVATTAL